MSKPSIQNVTTTQTFQNWLDKTNELVNIFRDSAITASVSGDETIGDANLVGEFGANTIVAYPSLHADEFIATTAGGVIEFGSPIEIVGAVNEIVATYNFAGSGAKTRFTEGTNSWDNGINNINDLDYVIGYNGADLFKLSPTGVLTVDSLVAETGISVVGGDITVDNVTVSQNLTANNATITNLTSNNIRGNFTGDIYHPQGNKIFENGGPEAGKPAVFTGNVNGTVSSLTNHTTNNLTEGSNNLYFTGPRVRSSLTPGTGVGIAADPNDSTKTQISIGQAVNTTSNVTFKKVKATDDITATGDVTANQFFGDGSALTGIVQLVKGFIAFNGSTGTVYSSSGLSLTKAGTGNYTINILPGFRPPDGNYAVVLGNVDREVKSQRTGTLGTQINAYNSFTDIRQPTFFKIRAIRNINATVYQVADDNNITQTFGITVVDPRYVTAILLY